MAEAQDELLLGAIESAEEASYGLDNDELSSERTRAIDYYLGRPMGNEIDGRSHVISRDVSDTIEWIKPSLLRIFTSGDEICRFDPTGPEDMQSSEQESDYINYVIQQKNNWFAVCYTWFTDALLTKNAYALAFWDEKKDTTTERYRGLTDDQMALLAQDENVEIVRHSQTQGMMSGVGPDGRPFQNASTYHDVELKQTKYSGCVKIQVLPPERCLIAENTAESSLKDCPFFEYWDLKTISELREMGFDVPDDINDDRGSIDTVEDDARDQFGESSTLRDADYAHDPAMRKVRTRMCWIKHDYDGDGLSEYRYVCLVGRTILANEDVSSIPVACIVPVPLPHRHPGLSVYDQVSDVQEIKTAMLRQIVDNTYLQNNGRHAISDKVNLDDMMTSRPGGVVRIAGGGVPANEIMPLVHPFVAPQALQVVEYLDQIRQNRTGTNQYFQGVDTNALNKTASGIAQLTSSAAQRVELIARVFAEGVKELFLTVHELTLKHARSQEVVKLRGKWVPVDPRQWKKRSDMTLAVGLGTGNKEQLAAGLMNILMAQKEAIAIGVATPKNLYNALAELTKAYGFSTPEKFWTEPPDGPLPPPPPDPKIELAREELAHTKQKDVAEYGLRKEEMGLKYSTEQKQIGVTAGAKLADIELEKEKIATGYHTHREGLEHDMTKHQDITGSKETQAKTTSGVERLERNMESLVDQLQALVQSQQAVLAGLERVAQIAAAERVSTVERDPRTGRVAGGRSRLVMPDQIQ